MYYFKSILTEANLVWWQTREEIEFTFFWAPSISQTKPKISPKALFYFIPMVFLAQSSYACSAGRINQSNEPVLTQTLPPVFNRVLLTGPRPRGINTSA